MAAPITLCGSISRLPGLLGRAIHEAAYQALGLPFTYVPFEVTDLSGALAGMRALNIRGLGVSEPFKRDVIPLLDEVEPLAARIGAVNTLVCSAGRVTGHNTDWVGAVRALQEKMPLEGARVLLLGAGGAARAVAFGLVHRSAVVTIANRTVEKAQALARQVGACAASWDETLRAAAYDAVVNATTLGQQGAVDAVPVAAPLLGPGQIVMDIVYKPLRTRWLAEAEARGIRTLHGGRMLLHQAAAQVELYTGRRAPVDAMEDALRRAMAG